MPRKQKVTDPNDPMAVLARVALEEQAEKAAERDNKRRAQAESIRQNQIQEKEAADTAFYRQRFCDHLLGNHRTGVVPDFKRCALLRHTHSDKSIRIYCGKCRAEWQPGDTNTTLLRTEGYPPRPIRLPNPTGKGWKAINDFFFTFPNSKDLTTIAFRVERVEPEYMPEEDDAVAV